MSLLISGSLAYDYIMDFPDSFKNHILPDQIHILNVCFVVEKLNKNFGGCAGNIAYTAKLLGAEPIILAPLGSDAREYMEHFQKNNISTKYMPIIENSLTSSAHITTDKDDNQIIAYHNGVADRATDLTVSQVEESIDLALITPTKKEAMIKHAKECYEKKIPFVFDPSHQLTAFTAQELMMLIGQAKFYISNDYEMKLTQEKTGWDMAELLNHVEVVITTLGEKGSVITTKDQIIEVGVCPASSVEDPTGAGDAYRSGFFIAYTQGHDYKTCGQVGAV
ncbi:MAG: carbohydrate kinase family protein, partial [Candidatus Magasanikiibacteriota bacterium]